MTDQQTITTIHAAVAGLADHTRALPHDIQHTARALQVIEEQRRLHVADGADTGEQVSTVLRALLNAEQALQVANVHLREADGRWQ
uniref:Uncharacterized protein n=1 Tax=Streptomyces sp. NBC_01401 TaxID=2903854 RepID=A0AAU3H9Y1_9ACTN